MAVVIQLRGDISDNWESANPVLAEREMAIETDTDLFKVGNGTSNWNDLPYGGIQGENGLPGATGPVVGTIDGGVPNTLYGGSTVVDGGTP
jgi:hypothetical protein